MRRIALLLVLLAAFLTACASGQSADMAYDSQAESGQAYDAPSEVSDTEGGGTAASGSGMGADDAGTAAGDAETAAGGDAAAAASEVVASLGAVAAPGVAPSVIKTAELELELARGEFRARLQEATGIAALHGGYVLSSTVRGHDARSGSLALRVPAERFELALASVHELGEVKRETVTGEEVGQEFVDLEARLRNLRGQEGVLLGLYDQTTTIAESIRVQNEVSAVQLRIEELEGRLRYLKDRAALGTISLSLREVGAPAPKPDAPFARAWERAVGVIVSIGSSIVYSLGYLIPLGLLALLLIPIARRAWGLLPKRP